MLFSRKLRQKMFINSKAQKLKLFFYTKNMVFLLKTTCDFYFIMIQLKYICL